LSSSISPNFKEEAEAINTDFLFGGDDSMKSQSSSSFLSDIFDEQSINDLLKDWGLPVWLYYVMYGVNPVPLLASVTVLSDD
jgi:hypothetical protein